MQTLVFNTATKTVILYENVIKVSQILHQFETVPTVRVKEGFYEVIQDAAGSKYPVLRVPISNTNMIILN